ncbi:hypothetical protein NP493_466g00012 [Ridgeia piscesae]|uniref:Uncharacterized protein n=1 Tax=Ridgeia piscesae TaxID=27915 RepID=A0AAD9L007_RIDPI|nr:hypothetical protein NP493_466g00012 [Ridgeia piscesae]
MAPVSISVSNVAVAGSSILADGKATVNTVKKRLPLSNHARHFGFAAVPASEHGKFLAVSYNVNDTDSE